VKVSHLGVFLLELNGSGQLAIAISHVFIVPDKLRYEFWRTNRDRQVAIPELSREKKFASSYPPLGRNDVDI